MRGMVTPADCPLLFASTYQAGELVTLPSEPCADEAAAERRRTGAHVLVRAHALALTRLVCAPQ